MAYKFANINIHFQYSQYNEYNIQHFYVYNIKNNAAAPTIYELFLFIFIILKETHFS